jgi:heme oxygenase
MDVASAEQYRSFLARVYGFEAAVERRVSSITGLADAAAGARARIGRLYRDLAALGLSQVDIAALPQASVEPRTATEGLGWLFVIERHVLLAGLIRRFLASELGDVFARAREYFDTHLEAGEQLREVGEALSDAFKRGGTRPDAAVGAARRAFEAQAQWYSRTRRSKEQTGPRRTPAPEPRQPRDAA